MTRRRCSQVGLWSSASAQHEEEERWGVSEEQRRCGGKEEEWKSSTAVRSSYSRKRRWEPAAWQREPRAEAAVAAAAV
jgi:hypothetical protein